MKYVIDITEEVYDEILNEIEHAEIAGVGLGDLSIALKNGTPLPSGHGRLIDADRLIKDNGLDKATKYGNKTKEQLHFSYDTMMMYEIFDLIDDAEVVVEADEEESEEE